MSVDYVLFAIIIGGFMSGRIGLANAQSLPSH
jgi:hypothetical protein